MAAEDRYSRQEAFPPIGRAGQALLQEKHVLIVGAGALGSGSAEMLARAGVGKLSIVDRDVVEWSNLQRQVLYAEEDAEARLPKAVAAERRLKQVNSSVQVESHVLDGTAEELLRLANGVDLIMDATDNFETRWVINDMAYKFGVPWIYGACIGSYGQSCVFVPGRTACLGCLLETVPVQSASCDLDGIVAPAVQMVVAHQTAEALKWLTGNEQALSNRLTVFDLWDHQYQSYRVSSRLRRADCPTCGAAPTYPHLQYVRQMKTEVLCGRNSVWIRPAGKGQIDVRQLGEKVRAWGRPAVVNPFLVSIDDPEHRIVIFQDGRALVHGTDDPATAKKLYHRYLG